MGLIKKIRGGKKKKFLKLITIKFKSLLKFSLTKRL